MQGGLNENSDRPEPQLRKSHFYHENFRTHNLVLIIVKLKINVPPSPTLTEIPVFSDDET